MAFTEFYCQNGGSNLNAGSTTSNTAAYTSTNGNWSTTTRIFIPTDGSTPASFVSAGDFVSIYNDGATQGVYIARVTAVAAGVNGGITTDAVAIAGTPPTTSATARSIKAGGAFKGPNGAIGWPFGIGNLSGLKNAAGDLPRINFKNDAIYSISVGLSTSVGPLFIQGYTTTLGDRGRAIIDTGTNAIIPLTVNGTLVNLIDLIVQTTATSGTNDGFSIGNTCFLLRCVAHGFRGNGFNMSAAAYFKECEAYDNNKSNTAGNAGFKLSSNAFLENCISHDNTGSNTDGFTCLLNAIPVIFINCIADTNGRHGFAISGTNSPTVSFWQCDAYNNAGDGIKNLLTTTNSYTTIKNCNFIKNAGWGINSALTTGRWFGTIENCGFGAGTQANVSGTTNAIDLMFISGSVTYATGVTPWVDPANGDFRINLQAAADAGRGAFTETAAGYAGTIGFPDIGAAAAPSGFLGLGETFKWVAQDAYVNNPYYVASSFVAGGNFTIAIISGSLPPGIALSQIVPYGWLLSGTPTTAGSYSALAQLTDTLGAQALTQWDITVYPDPDQGTGGVGGG
jgi:hypothetical protein